MNHLRLLVVALAATAAACGPADRAPATTPVTSAHESAIDLISSDGLREHLAWLADVDERPVWNEGDFFGEKFARE